MDKKKSRDSRLLSKMRKLIC